MTGQTIPLATATAAPRRRTSRPLVTGGLALAALGAGAAIWSLVPPATSETPTRSERTVAGWNWAQSHGVTDPARCTGNDEAFTRGCLAFVSQPTDPAHDNIGEAM